MQSIDDKILSRIYGNGRGYSFTSFDFIREFKDNNIDKALSTLTKEGKIRRIARGIYDYPKYSELLQQALSPDIDAVAQAYARKFNWQIEISGESALNYLGLSTQVEGNYIYLSSGPNRQYQIDNTTLTFKHTALKNIGFKYKESSLLVQALKALGENHTDATVKEKLVSWLNPAVCNKVLKDTQTATTWIYETIKEICKKVNSHA
jgi:hypothetical protein